MAETLDPNSLILSHYSNVSIDCVNSSKTHLKLITDPYFMERGPNYNAYAQLRESKLRSKRLTLYEDEKILEIPKSEISPVKKSVRFQGNSTQGKKQGYSVFAQSVPDFSSALRKENRKPVQDNCRIPRIEKSATPPAPVSKRERMYGSGGGGGSKSVNTGEKQSMILGRKSYASIEELKGLSIAASNAINGENKGAKRGGNLLRKSTVFSSTRYY